jgi:hypothetical protein
MRLTLLLLGSAVIVGMASAVGCLEAPSGDEDTGDSTAHIEEVDPLEGAYIKQGGTPLFFVFKKGETKSDNTFFGEIDVDGGAERASGKVMVGRDNLGTTMTLTQSGKVKSRTLGDAGPDAAPADLQAADTRALVDQAFSGTVHFLKIGKNQTILVRGDTNGKTAHYKKAKTWCGTDDDCSSDVQNTGLDCSSVMCTSKSTCACNNGDDSSD